MGGLIGLSNFVLLKILNLSSANLSKAPDYIFCDILFYLVGIIKLDISCESSTSSRTGADPGFLERGFICIAVWGFALLIYLICLKLFHFHRTYKNGGQRGGFKRTP